MSIDISPYDHVWELYERIPQSEPLEVYLAWHLRYGFVFSTPVFFIMGFRADREKLASDCDPCACFNPSADCWYIFAMSGDMSNAWSILPEALPFIAFHREGTTGKRLQIVPLSTIERLTRINHG